MAEPIALGSGAGQDQRWRRLVTMAIPLSVVAVVVVLVVPLPTFVVDLLITANITGSILILLTAMQVKRPLDFSVFPTLVLVATMFRLALNVAATRLILLHGYAGVVIESFGHFVIGGSILVGLVVFFILIIIQFVVITSGAGRVAEVAARFTLDGMPGKQMAIDADLHAGAIDENEARRRRQEVAERGRFLRGDGRRLEVRPRRRHRRRCHHRHQPDRRSRHRGGPAPPFTVRRHLHLQLAGHRRWVGLADPRPAALALDRHHRDPGRHGPRSRPRRPDPIVPLPADCADHRIGHGGPRHHSRAAEVALPPRGRKRLLLRHPPAQGPGGGGGPTRTGAGRRRCGHARVDRRRYRRGTAGPGARARADRPRADRSGWRPARPGQGAPAQRGHGARHRHAPGPYA